MLLTISTTTHFYAYTALHYHCLTLLCFKTITKRGEKGKARLSTCLMLMLEKGFVMVSMSVKRVIDNLMFTLEAGVDPGFRKEGSTLR